MSKTYKVVVAGMGKRGKHHAGAFKKNPRFELAGICDPVAAQLEKSAPDLGNPKTSTDAAALIKEVKPDLFCFCTPPNLRLPLIKLGIESGAKMIAYEKPMAPTMTEAIEIRKAVQASGVKTVVSHQHRYGEHYKKARVWRSRESATEQMGPRRRWLLARPNSPRKRRRLLRPPRSVHQRF